MARRARADGFTVVEVIVASTLLVVGVLAAALLLDVANTETASAKARTAGNNVARRVIEVARTVALNTVEEGTGPALVQARAPDLADDDPAPGWTVRRGGVTYTIGWESCVLDDPSDGTADSAARTPAYCSQPAASTPADTSPADARRVTVTVTWRLRPASTAPEQERSVRAVTVLPLGVGDLPVVQRVLLEAPTTCTASCTITGDTARFRAETNISAASMTWLADGVVAATCPPADACTGSATTWRFDWPLGTPTRETATGVNAGRCKPGTYRPDGTYEVGARAADPFGRARSPVSQTVLLNRCSPWPVTALAAGRSFVSGVNDVTWAPPADGDIIGYRVYKGTSTASMTPACGLSAGGYLPVAKLSCSDSQSVSGSSYFYFVAPVDRTPQGAVREGYVTGYNIQLANRAPARVSGITAIRAGGEVRLTWAPSSDPDGGDQVDGYRIYRVVSGRTPGVADRIALVDVSDACPEGSTTCQWPDEGAPAGVTYYITAVDTRAAESTISAGVSA